jgi:DnaJ homolog subfamily B member 11
MNPYEVLGVPQGASIEAIRKAYKARARECHPDKNQGDPEATEKFKQIQAAYEALTTEQIPEQPPFAPFQQFFGGFNFRFQPPPIVQRVSCSLEELYRGCSREIRVVRTVMGCEDTLTLKIDIPKGSSAGEKMVLHGAGHRPAEQFSEGDIVVVIDSPPHPSFERRGNDLYTKKTLTLKEALLGTVFRIQLLDSTELAIQVASGVVQPGATHTIAGKGMAEQGALVIQFQVQLPSDMTAEQKAVIEAMF